MAANFKKKRFKCPKNLKLMRSFACHVCGQGPSEVHHLKTKGSGGGDELSNLMSLCRTHHFEIHALGPTKFFEIYDFVNPVQNAG